MLRDTASRRRPRPGGARRLRTPSGTWSPGHPRRTDPADSPPRSRAGRRPGGPEGRGVSPAGETSMAGSEGAGGGPAGPRQLEGLAAVLPGPRDLVGGARLEGDAVRDSVVFPRRGGGADDGPPRDLGAGPFLGRLDRIGPSGAGLQSITRNAW